MDLNKNNHINNIIFDMDGTLIHRLPRRVFFIQDYLAKHGIEMTETQSKEAGRWSHKFWEGVTTYDPNGDQGEENPWLQLWLDYLDHYTELLDLPRGSLDSLFETLAIKIEEERGVEQLMPGALEVLPVLAERGYRLGVLSNRHKPIQPVIEGHGLGEFFEVVRSSGELKAEKPSPEIFYRYLDIFGGKPKETLYVGDNYWLDGLGAKAAGLEPLLLDMYGWFEDFDIQTISHLDQLIIFLA